MYFNYFKITLHITTVRWPITYTSFPLKTFWCNYTIC